MQHGKEARGDGNHGAVNKLGSNRYLRNLVGQFIQLEHCDGGYKPFRRDRQGRRGEGDCKQLPMRKNHE